MASNRGGHEGSQGHETTLSHFGKKHEFENER
jgi:hypothetical protein